jgi:transposase
MKLLYRSCAGMDVHKSSVSVCLRRRVRGGQVEVEEAVFGTFTRDLEQLRDWLKQRRVRHVAMESTGVYWIPVIRHLRELVRMRVHIQQDRNRVINRVGRLLETVNIKLASVASNIVGKSGRAILM